jgi:lysophospholipase L1-like esterase
MRTSSLVRGLVSIVMFGGLAAASTLMPTALAQGVVAPAVAPDRFEIPATDDGLPGMGPVRRYTWFRKLWHDKRQKWATEIAQDQGAVVLLGDSITQGWNDRLPAAFPGMKVANRGISGDTTRGVLIRLEDDVLTLNPTAVVLLIGTNDLEEGARPDVVESNMRLILTALREHNPRMPIVLCQVFPSSAKMKRPSSLIKDVNTRLLQLVKNDAQVTPVDTWRLWADADGDAPIAEFPDLLHLNDAGYARWAAALRPVLESLELVAPVTSPFTVEPGFEPLFNGRDLTGWGYRATTEQEKVSAAKWQASDPNAAVWPFVTEPVSFDGRTTSLDGRWRVIGDRIAAMTPAEYRKVSQLWTTKGFEGDFVLKLEFRATPYADGGVFLRGPQLQVRDYRLSGPYTSLASYRPQDWNELVVTVTGETAEVTCNGEVIEKAFKVPASGGIGLEADRGQMEYRRIRLSRR